MFSGAEPDKLPTTFWGWIGFSLLALILAPVQAILFLPAIWWDNWSERRKVARANQKSN